MITSKKIVKYHDSAAETPIILEEDTFIPIKLKLIQNGRNRLAIKLGLINQKCSVLAGESGLASGNGPGSRNATIKPARIINIAIEHTEKTTAR